MAPSRHGPAHSHSQPPALLNLIPPNPLPTHSNGGEVGIELRPHPPINMQDLRSIADDIKDTLSAAISELRLDLRALNDRVQVVERVTDHHETALHSVNESIDSYTLQMQDMQYHLEDLDNRGRRYNLRIRGLPESIEGEQISQSVVSLFNGLLHQPPQTPIAMERIQSNYYLRHYYKSSCGDRSFSLS